MATEEAGTLKSLILKVPVLRDVARAVYFTASSALKPFRGSEDYWKRRYEAGRSSGAGSYNELAEFKAEILNGFVAKHGIESVIEYGCGDGNQLELLRFAGYLGFDVSPEAVGLCRDLFAGDETKRFELTADHACETARLTLSLDVVYHLVEDEVFDSYMRRLFDSSTEYVIVYSSNTNEQARIQPAHVRHRRFTDWVAEFRPDWALIEHVPNRYPFAGDETSGSLADFYVFRKSAQRKS